MLYYFVKWILVGWCVGQAYIPTPLFSHFRTVGLFSSIRGWNPLNTRFSRVNRLTYSLGAARTENSTFEILTFVLVSVILLFGILVVVLVVAVDVEELRVLVIGG